MRSGSVGVGICESVTVTVTVYLLWAPNLSTTLAATIIGRVGNHMHFWGHETVAKPEVV